MANKEQDEYIIDISAKGFREVEKAKEELEFPSNADVIDLALSLLFWTIERSKNGETLGAVNQSKDKVVNLNIPDLEKLRKKYEENEKVINNENNA